MNFETIISAETTVTEDTIVNQTVEILHDLVDAMTSNDCYDICFDNGEGSYERCEIEDTIEFLEKFMTNRFTIS